MPAPIALQLYSVREAAAQDYAGVVRKVAAMGYAGVEWSAIAGVKPAEAARLFKDLGLALPSAHLPLPVGDKKNEAIDTAKAIGSPCIVSGKGPDDLRTIDLIKTTCDLFNEAHANARAGGLAFGIHNHWWEYLRVEGRYVYEVMLECLDPGIFFQIDTYWVKTAGPDPADIIKLLGKRAPSLHIKDGPCIKNVPMTAVGDGVMDFHSIIEAGGKNTEWLIVEIDRCVTDMMTAVEKSVRFLVNEGLGQGR